MTGTLGDMKARIVGELVRPDLTSQVALAISSAIERYRYERWWWAKASDVAITTTISLDNYPLDDSIAEIIAARWTNGATVNTLREMTWDEYRESTRETPSDGEPTHYVTYGDTLFVYPPPVAAGTISLDYWKRWTPPADDAEEDNPWMVAAEEMIRLTAKAIVYRDVIRDLDKSIQMLGDATMEHRRLKRQHNRRSGAGMGTVQPWPSYEPIRCDY